VEELPHRSADNHHLFFVPFGEPIAEGLSTDEREELRELRKKLRGLKQERDILAKQEPPGTAWFAPEKEMCLQNLRVHRCALVVSQAEAVGSRTENAGSKNAPSGSNAANRSTLYST
jgi:hypothetical protein